MLNKEPILILSNRVWNRTLARRIEEETGHEVYLISSKEDLTLQNVSRLKPRWIFAAHWSFLIPESIWKNWETVIFHMTDLPYGRGGSPLQNLIKSGHSSTAVSALRCNGDIDSGDIYLKKSLALLGSAEEIYLRTDAVIEEMIVEISRDKPNPQPQMGEPTYFRRRVPTQSNLNECSAGDLKSWHDHIRMLDADDYPHAYLESMGMKLVFRRASLRHDGIHADVVIAPIEIQHSTDSTQ